MPDTFQKKGDFEEEEIFADLPKIPSLTEDIVYCPKCGAINSFKKSKSGRLLNHFCKRCGLRMNDFWDGYLEGHIKQAICESCQQTTFEGSIYCIACGAKQEKAYRERADKISDELGEDLDLSSAMGEGRRPTEESRSKYPCFSLFCDCMICLDQCGDCLRCCVPPIAGCIIVQLFPKSNLIKSAFSISFVLFAMVQTIFYILYFHSYINKVLFFVIISAGIILAILVPIVLHKIFVKTKISE